MYILRVGEVDVGECCLEILRQWNRGLEPYMESLKVLFHCLVLSCLVVGLVWSGLVWSGLIPFPVSFCIAAP